MYSYETNHTKDKCLLAFDLSTKTLGFSIFSIETEKLIELSYYSFTKNTLLEKTDELNSKIEELCALYNIKIICIEERLKAFQQGFTNAESILKLASFNFYCQTIFYKKHILIKEIPSATARKLCIPNFHSIARKVKNMKQKELAFGFIVDELGESRFPKKIVSRGKNKGEEVFIEEAYDMSDAFILGRAGLIIMKDKI